MLVGLGAAVREEEDVDVARRDLRELCAQPGAHLRRRGRSDVRQHSRLLLDRPHDARVAMTDVHAHQLAVEVEEPFAVGRPEIGALGAGDGNRVERVLRGPFEERVLLRQGDDLSVSHGGIH